MRKPILIVGGGEISHSYSCKHTSSLKDNENCFERGIVVIDGSNDGMAKLKRELKEETFVINDFNVDYSLQEAKYLNGVSFKKPKKPNKGLRIGSYKF